MENSAAAVAKVEEWMEKLSYCKSSVDDDVLHRVLSSDPALIESLDKQIAQVSAQISQLKTNYYYDYPKTHGQGFAPLMIKDNDVVSEVEGVKPAAFGLMTDEIYESIDWKHKGNRYRVRSIISMLKNSGDCWSNSDHWINVLEKRLSEEEAAMGQESVDDDNMQDDMISQTVDPKLDPFYNPPELVAKVLNQTIQYFCKRPDEDICLPPDIYITADQILNFCKGEEEKEERLVAITRPEHDGDMDTDCEQYSLVSDELYDEHMYDFEDEKEEKTVPAAAAPEPAYTPPPPLPPYDAFLESMFPGIMSVPWPPELLI